MARAQNKFDRTDKRVSAAISWIGRVATSCTVGIVWSRGPVLWSWDAAAYYVGSLIGGLLALAVFVNIGLVVLYFARRA